HVVQLNESQRLNHRRTGCMQQQVNHQGSPRRVSVQAGLRSRRKYEFRYVRYLAWQSLADPLMQLDFDVVTRMLAEAGGGAIVNGRENPFPPIRVGLMKSKRFD